MVGAMGGTSTVEGAGVASPLPGMVRNEQPCSTSWLLNDLRGGKALEAADMASRAGIATSVEKEVEMEKEDGLLHGKSVDLAEELESIQALKNEEEQGLQKCWMKVLAMKAAADKQKNTSMLIKSGLHELVETLDKIVFCRNSLRKVEARKLGLEQTVSLIDLGKPRTQTLRQVPKRGREIASGSDEPDMVSRARMETTA